MSSAQLRSSASSDGGSPCARRGRAERSPGRRRRRATAARPRATIALADPQLRARRDRPRSPPRRRRRSCRGRGRRRRRGWSCRRASSAGRCRRSSLRGPRASSRAAPARPARRARRARPRPRSRARRAPVTEPGRRAGRRRQHGRVVERVGVERGVGSAPSARGSTRSSASAAVDRRPRGRAATAIRTAAARGERWPLRDCRIQSAPALERELDLAHVAEVALDRAREPARARRRRPGVGGEQPPRSPTLCEPSTTSSPWPPARYSPNSSGAAGRGVAGERDAGARARAGVAEHHRLHDDRGAGVGDACGSGGRASRGGCSSSRTRRAIACSSCAHGSSGSGSPVTSPSVRSSRAQAVVGEPCSLPIAAAKPAQRPRRQADVEDRVHHPRHRDRRARADADQQRRARRRRSAGRAAAARSPSAASTASQQAGRQRARLVVRAAGGGRDDEARAVPARRASSSSARSRSLAAEQRRRRHAIRRRRARPMAFDSRSPRGLGYPTQPNDRLVVEVRRGKRHRGAASGSPSRTACQGSRAARGRGADQRRRRCRGPPRGPCRCRSGDGAERLVRGDAGRARARRRGVAGGRRRERRAARRRLRRALPARQRALQGRSRRRGRNRASRSS